VVREKKKQEVVYAERVHVIRENELSQHKGKEREFEISQR